MTERGAGEADVIVVGGGPAGSACAAELARLGAGVILLHDERRRAWAVESLPPGSTGLVTSLLGPVLDEARGHRTVAGTRSAWGGGDLVETDYLSDPSDDAWVVNRRTLDVDARAAACALGVRAVDGRAGAVLRYGSRWTIDVAGGDVLTAPFVVDATGRAAGVARRLGMRILRRDRQVALVSSLTRTGERPGAGRDGTVVESCRDGWWYAVTLGDVLTVGLLVDADALPPRAERAAWWRSRLARTVHVRAVVEAAEGVPSGGPAPAASALPQASRADTCIAECPRGDGWLAVGDAAAAWDPLSSQGLAAGILMAGRAARAIASGRPALAEWQEDLRMLAEDTWGLQGAYYRLEGRWPEAPYWARRHAAPVLTAGPTRPPAP